MRPPGPDGPGPDGPVPDGPLEGVVYQVSPAPQGDGLYIIWGGAKFPISSSAELAALGVQAADVVQVNDTFLAKTGTVPAPQMLIRERSQAAVYWMTPQGAGVHIPNPTAMNSLSLPWDQVRTIPLGTINQIRPFEQKSIPQTPPSMVFNVNANGNADGGRWARTELPGHTLPNGNHVVEFFGWWGGTDDGPGSDPDWHAGVEPDYPWLERNGFDLVDFVKAGDIYYGRGVDTIDGQGQNPVCYGDASGAAALSIPILKMELDGWTARNWPAGAEPPEDWVGNRVDSPVKNPLDPNLTAVTYWGMVPSANQKPLVDPGTYVSISGNVVTDQPHVTGEQGALAALKGVFAAGLPEHDRSNAARWNELHSPDFIQPVTGPPDAQPGPYQKAYQLTAVLVASPDAGREMRIGPLELAQTKPPSVNWILNAVEIVAPESDPRTITTGNAGRTGAQLIVSPTQAFITIGVTSLPDGTPGKFKALYKTWWTPAPLRQMTVITTPGADTVPLRKPSRIQFDATDTADQAPLAGTVMVNNTPIGTTGTSFMFTFVGGTKREWEEGNPDSIPPVKGKWVTVLTPQPVTVHVDGYIDVTLDVGAVV
jgi:hypothetical protein